MVTLNKFVVKYFSITLGREAKIYIEARNKFIAGRIFYKLMRKSSYHILSIYKYVEPEFYSYDTVKELELSKQNSMYIMGNKIDGAIILTNDGITTLHIPYSNMKPPCCIPMQQTGLNEWKVIGKIVE